MKTLSAKAFSFLSWALESLYIYSIFFLTILFMAKWIRNNKYRPVDLISLVRSHISYLLQGNSILSNLSCQAYIEENHQSQIPNSSSWGQVLNSSNLLLPMNVPYCSVKQCLFQFFWPWPSIRNALFVTTWYTCVVDTHRYIVHVFMTKTKVLWSNTFLMPGCHFFFLNTLPCFCVITKKLTEHRKLI